MTDSIKHLCRELYSNSDAYTMLSALMELYAPQLESRISGKATDFSHKDIILITYGNQFQGQEPSLYYLNQFLTHDLKGEVHGVHVLPFNPYSSDEGFSSIDFLALDPQLGTWHDVRTISSSFLFMADLVVNHCSCQSSWFKKFLAQEDTYADYFIAVDPRQDLSATFRPRTSPLLSPYKTARGTKHIWTTFSADQVDLNYASPHLLREMINVMLYYILQGTQIIRLDAIAYLWKEIGTPSIHHPHTHHVVQLMRAVCDAIAPHVRLLTETNVPHQENISYFGNGNEAHMVYNFSLPPLTLDALVRGDASHLTAWAHTLQVPPTCTFFNFLASHDGIGMLPAAGYLTPQEQKELITTIQERGGMVSYKETQNGPIPYELNINYFSAVANPNLPLTTQCDAFLVAQAIMLSLQGVAAPYVHSVVGSTNWKEWKTGESGNRSINRERFNYQDIHTELTTNQRRAYIFNNYRNLIRIRNSEPLLSPLVPQEILSIDNRVFALKRESNGRTLVCLHNVSSQLVKVHSAELEAELRTWKNACDLVSNTDIAPDHLTPFQLKPYQVAWLTPKK